MKTPEKFYPRKFMIARRISMNSSSKSNIRRLVAYLTDTQGIAERVQEVRITGCESESTEWAALEMQAVQKMNHRAKGDRTYHLMLSFHEDFLNKDVLKKIEDIFCEKLGYGEHQRVSVVHGDTDNLHLHIAINKIHPQALTLHEPFYDHKILAQVCGQVEKTFQLKTDNHVFRAKSRETSAVNMERAGDLESLTGWIQRNCMKQMEEIDSWKALHDILSKQWSCPAPAWKRVCHQLRQISCEGKFSQSNALQSESGKKTGDIPARSGRSKSGAKLLPQTVDGGSHGKGSLGGIPRMGFRQYGEAAGGSGRNTIPARCRTGSRAEVV